jgi:tyrosyl-tRNA synthetase
MKLSEELQWRGFINQTTYDDLSQLDQAPISFYWGVDPSADSMTIGNFAAAMMVRHFIEHGHKAFLLVGGATGMIGDPDGKKDERNLKTLDEIAKNKAGIAEQYKTAFAGHDFTTVDNYDWFKNMNYLDFLRDIGKHVPMSQMLGRDFVKSRLGDDGSGISYAEFSYSLIQGYDFLHLHREYGVTLQVCGADQWGNSIAGVDLIRRIEGVETHVYSTPLVINKATGVKFGKSEGGAIWLDPKKTSVYKFYQFWLNVDDEGVIDYMKIYTLLSKEEIDKIHAEYEMNLSSRIAQKRLAEEVTILVHGRKRFESVKRVTDVLFGDNDVHELSDEDLDALAAEIPVVSLVDTSFVGNDVKTEMVSAVLYKASFAKSLGEARRLIEGGGVSVNGEKIHQDRMLTDVSLVKKGKNSFVLVR